MSRDDDAPTLAAAQRAQAAQAASQRAQALAERLVLEWGGVPPKSTIRQRWQIALLLDEYSRTLTERLERAERVVEAAKAWRDQPIEESHLPDGFNALMAALEAYDAE